MEHVLSGKARCGLLRDGERIYITFEFSSEYDSMQAFDTWAMEDINIKFKGPKELREVDNVVV